MFFDLFGGVLLHENYKTDNKNARADESSAKWDPRINFQFKILNLNYYNFIRNYKFQIINYSECGTESDSVFTLRSHRRSGPERTRTADLCYAKAVFYLLNYWPKNCEAILVYEQFSELVLSKVFSLITHHSLVLSEVEGSLITRTKGSLVDRRRFELPTTSMPWRYATVAPPARCFFYSLKLILVKTLV